MFAEINIMENTEKKKVNTSMGSILGESFEVFTFKKVEDDGDFWHNMCAGAAITFVGLMILAMFVS